MNLLNLRKVLVACIFAVGVSTSGHAQTDSSQVNAIDTLTFENLATDPKPAAQPTTTVTTTATQTTPAVVGKSTTDTTNTSNGTTTTPATTPVSTETTTPVSTESATTSPAVTPTTAPSSTSGETPAEEPTARVRQKTFIGGKRYNRLAVGVNGGIAQMGDFLSLNDYNHNHPTAGFGISATYFLGRVMALQLDIHMNSDLKGDSIRTEFLIHKLVAPSTFPEKNYVTKSFDYSLSGVFNLGSISFNSKKTTLGFFASAGIGMVNYDAVVTGTGFTTTFSGEKALMFPVGAGVKYKINDNVGLNAGYTMKFVDSDKFDATILNNNTDKYSYGYIGISFTLGKKGRPSMEWTNPITGMFEDLSDNSRFNQLRKKMSSLQEQIDSVNINMNNKIDSLKADTDGDGVLDIVDKEAKTPKGAMVDGSGRAVDSDGDGIIDLYDRCPFEKGTAAFNGCKKQMGKTSKGDTKTADDAANKVYFAKNSTDLKDDASAALNKLAQVMSKNPSYKLLITGYTDADGDKTLNERLSVERANAVREYLAKQGVPEDRMKTQGLGQKVFLDNNITSAGKQKNRVVTIEFVVF